MASGCTWNWIVQIFDDVLHFGSIVRFFLDHFRDNRQRIVTDFANLFRLRPSRGGDRVCALGEEVDENAAHGERVRFLFPDNCERVEVGPNLFGCLPVFISCLFVASFAKAEVGNDQTTAVARYQDSFGINGPVKIVMIVNKGQSFGQLENTSFDRGNLTLIPTVGPFFQISGAILKSKIPSEFDVGLDW